MFSGYWYRGFSRRSGMDKLVKDMSEKELISVFSSEKSNRMEVLKAGERLLHSNLTLSETVCQS